MRGQAGGPQGRLSTGRGLRHRAAWLTVRRTAALAPWTSLSQTAGLALNQKGMCEDKSGVQAGAWGA